MGNAGGGARRNSAAAPRRRRVPSIRIPQSLLRRLPLGGGQNNAASEIAVDLSPCHEPFPSGLGPLSVRAASLRVEDVLLENTVAAQGHQVLRGQAANSASVGCALQVRQSYFARSGALRSVATWADRTGAWVQSWSGEGLALQLCMSPPHAVNLPPGVCDAFDMHANEELHFAWVYPMALPEDYFARDPVKPDAIEEGDEGGDYEEQDEVIRKATGSTASAENADEEELDPDDANVSFFTVGGFVYFRAQAADAAEHAVLSAPIGSLARVAPAPGPGEGLGPRCEYMRLSVLKAYTIRFSTAGAIQFSAPRRWEPTWTGKLAAEGRFLPITVRKWDAAGARYFCWVRPDEPLPDARGNNRPMARHGGFAFLFHGLDESDSEGLDRYFEIVAAPGLNEAPREPKLRRLTSLPFSLRAAPPGHEVRLFEKMLALASDGRWPLVRHLLAEYPHLASASDESGTTLLHVCARKDVQDAELLGLLHRLGAPCDAVDTFGRSPEDLAGSAFKALFHQLWGLSPDLFDDPQGWFHFWDRDHSNVLDPEQLGDALASAYRCSEVGSKWVKSYVNIHHPDGITEADLLGDHGLLQVLQTSGEFAGLRHQRTPPLFHGPYIAPLRDAERAQLMQLEERLEILRAKTGWEFGKRAPPTAIPLPLPAPAAEGSADPAARLRNARAMLSFSFEQTRCMSHRAWQAGFRIDFAGQEGLDDGGLTKAWVNELAVGLWGDNSLFDVRSSGCFFKPDDVEVVCLDDVAVPTLDLYHWTGRFVGYALFRKCLLDCRLCSWTFRCLLRAAAPRHFYHPRSAAPDWPDTAEGEDAMLSDLASLDHVVASSLWRVRHEMGAEELSWLDFTYAGAELEPGGAGCEVTPESRARYVRLSCSAMLRQRCHSGIQAFCEGFFEVVPMRVLEGTPEDGVLRLLVGEAEVSDTQLRELERVVVPGGLVPTSLRNHPRVREAASWLFRAAREGDSKFRVRLLEFWIGVGRVPLAGMGTIRPRPRLQFMVQPDGGGGIKRIASWPRERLPEGHTCGNELWMALANSYEEAAARLRTAVGNFEAGFALR